MPEEERTVRLIMDPLFTSLDANDIALTLCFPSHVYLAHTVMRQQQRKIQSHLDPKPFLGF